MPPGEDHGTSLRVAPGLLRYFGLLERAVSPIRVKLLVGGLVLAGALGYLGVSGAQSGWVYFLDVDRFVADGAQVGVRARVHGMVAAEGVELNRAELWARFTLVGGTRRLTVEYRGAVPELFQAGREVVVEGAMNQGGTFEADLLLTKCSSKYEGHKGTTADTGERGQ